MRSKRCFEIHTPGFRAWFDLYAAVAARDSSAMQRSAALALQLSDARLPRGYLELALTAGVCGALQSQGPKAALDFFGRWRRDYLLEERSPLELRLLLSTAARRASRL